MLEHHWLDYPDGGCADVDAEGAAGRIAQVLEQAEADTVLTFGPDGFTGHPDHRAVSAWVDRAVARSACRPRLLHAVATAPDIDWELAERFGVYELGRPRLCAVDEVAVRLRLEGTVLDRKVDALAAQASQTAGILEAVGPSRFRRWVATESFAAPERA